MDGMFTSGAVTSKSSSMSTINALGHSWMIIGVLFKCGLGRDLLLDLDLGFDLLSARGLLKLSARSLGSDKPLFSKTEKY
jgi:hypothetical protein